MADLRVVIADDEPLARQRIEDLLARERGIDVAGTASTGDEAIEIIRRTKPDLVFLDVQMPAKSGLEVVEAIGADAMPATIFVTAFDRFALKAFDVAAIDYLLKPFDDERFAQALKRARKSIDSKEFERMTRRLLQFLDQERPKFLEQIAVESRGQVRVVPVADIDYIRTSSGGKQEVVWSAAACRRFSCRQLAAGSPRQAAADKAAPRRRTPKVHSPQPRLASAAAAALGKSA